MTWWRRLVGRKRLDEQLDKELRFHLEQYTTDLIAQGKHPEEARRLARIAFGGEQQVREQCRDARGTRWLEDLWQDFRYGVRTLRQRPAFAAVALLTLALGCGATTVMFTVVNGVLFKPFPYPEPDRLVAVNGESKGWNTALYRKQNLAYYDFLDLKEQSRALDLAGWFYTAATLSQPGDAEYVVQEEVSSNLFAVLGAAMLSGRAFSAVTAAD